MAIYSMTGFGAGSATATGLCVSVELSSVNRKQLDVNIALPRNLVTLDALVQKQVRAVFSRGRVSGIIRVESTESGGGAVKVDEALASAYVKALRKTAATLELDDNLSAETLIRIPGLVVLEQDDVDADAVAEVLEQALGKALMAMAQMRAVEGQALVNDLRERLALLEKWMDAIEKLSGHIVKAYRERLLDRLAEAHLDGLESDERIVKEVALFADRCDISEELTRLKSHLNQVRELFKTSEPIGRTLDFLCQELFREINTIGSKANDVEITQHVVQFKTELERIREQVQNIE